MATIVSTELPAIIIDQSILASIVNSGGRGDGGG